MIKPLFIIGKKQLYIHLGLVIAPIGILCGGMIRAINSDRMVNILF